MSHHHGDADGLSNIRLPRSDESIKRTGHWSGSCSVAALVPLPLSCTKLHQNYSLEGAAQGAPPTSRSPKGAWDRGAVSPADTDRQTAGRLAAWEMVRNQLQKLSGCQDFTPKAIFKC